MSLQNYVAGVLVLIGSHVRLTASIGLLRLPDLYTRMHAASKAGTLGSCVMLLALAVYADDLAVTHAGAGGVAVLPADRAGLRASAGKGCAWRRATTVAKSVLDDYDGEIRRQSPRSAIDLRGMDRPESAYRAFGRATNARH